MAQIDKIQYTAKANTTGGRDGGACRSSDGNLDIKLSLPGIRGTGTNPEQLLAPAGLLALHRRSKSSRVERNSSSRLIRPSTLKWTCAWTAVVSSFKRGSTLACLANGAVIEQRLYQLIRQTTSIVDRRFEIEFLDPGVQAFDFTFG